MLKRATRILVSLPFLCPVLACSGPEEGKDAEASHWVMLLDDGAVPTSTLGVTAVTPSTASNRYCTDCTTTPLAWWKLDFCNSQSTELEDSADSTPISHPAFRAVGVECVAGREGQAVQLARADDILYSPDQPDYDFNQGLTVAAWIEPDSVERTQSLVRKRFDGTSAFAVAIEKGQVEFALRLNKKKPVGIAAPIEPATFAHIAATYDGSEMRIYLDGTLAASREANGNIAAGTGPIFIGNDASGRQFEGIVDEIWLNTLAAPPDTIKGLNCSRLPPIVNITPASSSAIAPNTPFAFDVSVTNAGDPTFCPADTYVISPTLPYPLTTDIWYSEVTVAAGQTGHATVNISAIDASTSGPVTFYYTVYNQANYSLNAIAQATFVVAPSP